MDNFQTIDLAELETVNGGFLDQLLKGGLAGALQGLGQGIQSGGGVDSLWRGALAGGLQGLAGTGASLIQQGGQSQQPQQPTTQQAA